MKESEGEKRKTHSEKLPKVIYVMGAPGAGKGTQAYLLAQKIGYHQFSTGDVFRKMRQQDSELGRKVKENYDKGLLQPPELAAQVVVAAVKERIGTVQGLVFDGTPRTMPESEVIDELFQQQGLGTPMAIYLKVDREEMMRRTMNRKFCLGVASDFPVMTPEDEKRCLDLGGEVGKRPDDKPEEMITRWDEFMNRTYPVVEKYQKQGMVREVDGMKSVEEVHAAVMEVVNSF